MSQAGHNVAANNHQIFAKFKTAFRQGDAGTFLNTAKQLVPWLQSDKAYYAAARPDIVDMIEIAQSAIPRVHGHGTSAPNFHVSKYSQSGFAPVITAYVQMVEVVRHYRNLFPEPPLQARIHKLLLTITAPGAALTSSQTLSSETRANPPVSGPPLEASSSLPSPPTDAPSPHILPPSLDSSVVRPTPISMSIPYVAPHASGATPATHVVSAPLAHKAKKLKPRKSLNLGFLNGDLEWFAEQQTVQKTDVPTAEAQETTGKSVPIVSVQSPSFESPVATVPVPGSTSANAKDVPESTSGVSAAIAVSAGDRVIRDPGPVAFPPTEATESAGATDTVSQDISNEPVAVYTNPVASSVNSEPAHALASNPTQPPATVSHHNNSTTEPPLPSTPLQVVHRLDSTKQTPAHAHAEGDLAREDSPDVPLVRTIQLNTERRRSTTATSSPVAAATPCLPVPQIPTNAGQPSGPMSLKKKKKGRPPGVRTLPIIPADNTLMADLPSSPEVRYPQVSEYSSLLEHSTSRKRSLSAAADEPPQQRRRIDEPVQVFAVAAAVPVDTASIVAPPTLDSVPMAVSPVATSSSLQPVAPTGAMPHGSPHHDGMIIANPTEQASPQASSPVLLTSSLLSVTSREEGELSRASSVSLLPVASKEEGEFSRAPKVPVPSVDSREEGELSQSATPMLASTLLPPPAEDYEVGRVGESQHFDSPNNESASRIPAPRPSTERDANIGGSERIVREAPEHTLQLTPESPPRRSSAVLPPYGRPPMRLPSTNVAPHAESVYGPSLEIMGIAWGSNKPTTSVLTAMLTEHHIEQLKRWTDKEKLDGDLSDSRCMSLAPYRFSQLYEVFSRSGDITSEELLKLKPIPWQNASDLSLQVNGGERIAICTPQLSYAANKDYLVDITTHPKNAMGVLSFSEGANSIKITQHGDLLNFAWVLALHSPSPAQLRALQMWRDREADWKAFVARLVVFSPPLFSIPPLSS